MKIKALKEFTLGIKPKQVRSCDVNLGYETGMLFVYSESEDVDPCDSMFSFYDKPLHFAMYGGEGQQLWHREMGISLIPGTWFVPFIAHDMDKDGVDEIWFVNNTSPNMPLMVRSRVLERLNARTGETIGQYPFPSDNIGWVMLCEAYRYMLFGGYVNGEPVIVTQQGTYKEMYFQCYNSDMSIRWTRVIQVNEGARGSHEVPVIDINQDGIDEVLFGEHLMSLDTGEDLFCLDKDSFFGHSDVVLPFVDRNTKKGYIYTCRESANYEGCPRIVMFDYSGNRVWANVYTDPNVYNSGHINSGFVFITKPDFKRIAVGYNVGDNTEHIFDAITGEPVKLPPSFDEMRPMEVAVRPIDLNGDGYHEFIRRTGEVYSGDGKMQYYVGGKLIRIGKWYDYQGEQFMSFYSDEQKVRIWGDVEAEDSDALLDRYHGSYKRTFMQKMTGNGYNFNTSIDCGG